MLLQSHAGEIHLLPALPAAWADGEVRGLRARGGLEIDLTWKNGILATATFKPSMSGSVRVRVRRAAESRAIELRAGQSYEFTP